VCSLVKNISSSTWLLYYLIFFAQLYSKGSSFLNLSLPASLEKHRAHFPWRMTTYTVHLWGWYWDITAKKLSEVPHRKKITIVFNTAKAHRAE